MRQIYKMDEILIVSRDREQLECLIRYIFDVLSGRKDRDSEDKNRISIQIAQSLYFGFLMAIIWPCSKIENTF